MTVCNMSIECGARGGMIAPDQTTFDYLRGRERAPQGAAFVRPRPAGANFTATPTRFSTRNTASTPPTSPR